MKKKPPPFSNILVIGATNRAADLDPALLRPGRFDRSIHFDVPTRSGRREIIDYYLDKKAHVPELDKEERRDVLAAMTFGYTPVMIEHLFDEALVWALRDRRDAMDWRDVQQAKMTEEIGLKQPVEYTEEEKRTIATHEAGHAVVAYLVGQNRKLEVLSIIKRRDALGLLAHSDNEERYTRTRSELVGIDEDRVRRHDGRGAVLRRVGHRSGRRPRARHAHRGADGRLVRHGRLAGVVRGGRGRARSRRGSSARCSPTRTPAPSVERLLDQAKADVHTLLDENRHLVIALRDELLEREELVGDEIIDVLHEAEKRHGIATDRRAVARAPAPENLTSASGGRW